MGDETLSNRLLKSACVACYQTLRGPGNGGGGRTWESGLLVAPDDKCFIVNIDYLTKLTDRFNSFLFDVN